MELAELMQFLQLDGATIDQDVFDRLFDLGVVVDHLNGLQVSLGLLMNFEVVLDLFLVFRYQQIQMQVLPYRSELQLFVERNVLQ